jgi:hypothetical protein
MGYRLVGRILDEIHTGVHTLSTGKDLARTLVLGRQT